MTEEVYQNVLKMLDILKNMQSNRQIRNNLLLQLSKCDSNVKVDEETRKLNRQTLRIVDILKNLLMLINKYTKKEINEQ